MKKSLLLLLFSVVVLGAMAVKKPIVMNLWPAGAPHKSADAADTAKVYVYLPDAAKATGKAVVICPGGGYVGLSMGHEGKDWAPYLNKMGVAAIVLKYRLPHGDKRIPLEDAEEAVKLVRLMANSWHIDPQKVGIMGFSAGGHLASVVATQARGESAPNYQLLFYPVITMDPGYTHKVTMTQFLGEHPSKKNVRIYSSDQQVSRVTPRAFIALCDDDMDVLPANGVNYYLECYRHDVPATLHVYPSGGHGWGCKPDFAAHIQLMLDLELWFRSF